MLRNVLILVTLALLSPWIGTNAASGTSPAVTPAVLEPLPLANPAIQKIVGEISAARIEANIRKLVGFGTRHTLSDTEGATRGIGAARRWIKSQFDEYSRASGARLKVEFDEFTQQPTRRISKPVQIVNVVATLTGSQPESKDRIYVVSGHYDSRASDALDATSEAPGANDDASGTAAVIELARDTSQYQ